MASRASASVMGLAMLVASACTNPFGGSSSPSPADTGAADTSTSTGKCVDGELLVETTSGAGLTVTAAYLYWTEDHRVRRRPLDGGAAEDVVTLLTGYPQQVAVSGDYVYFTSFGSTTTSGRIVSLGRAFRDGGAVTWLVQQTDTDFVVARSFAVDGDTVYYASEDGTVRSTGASTRIIGTYTESHPPQQVAVGGPVAVYTVFEGIVAGVDGTVFVAKDPGAEAIAADADHLYYGASGLKQVSFSTHEVRTLVPSQRVDSIAVDDRYVYFDTGRGVDRLPIGSTTVESFACTGDPSAIALSPTHLYTLSSDGIRRHPKGYSSPGKGCAVLGAACTSTTCCDGLTCTGGTCVAGCRPFGHACTTSVDCCHGGCGVALGTTAKTCMCAGRYDPCKSDADCCTGGVCDLAKKWCDLPVPTCTSPKVLCLADRVCADLNNDSYNCGSCGRICTAGPGHCYLGVCHTDCRGTDSLCDASCLECCSKRCVPEGSTHRCVP